MACTRRDCNEKASTFFHKRQDSESMPTQKYWASTRVSAGNNKLNFTPAFTPRLNQKI